MSSDCRLREDVGMLDLREYWDSDGRCDALARSGESCWKVCERLRKVAD